MKKLSIYFMLLSSIILLQCTKEDNPNGPGVITDLPVYIQPTQPGYIQTSATSLVLRAGNSATVNAKLYKSDGTVEPIQPTFLWSTQDSSVALVNNGIIQAVGKGQAEIAVSDSIHGISYITVSVLSTTDTITVPGGIYSISYSQPVVILQKGGSKSITYRLNNSSGQQIGGTIDAFMVDPASGITVSNTGTITAGQTTGIFYAYARVGSDTIGHPFRIVVYDPAVTNTTPVYDMRLVLVPRAFFGKNKKSRPVRIEVTESFIDSTGTPNVRVFQTSPTRIELNESGILELESTGRLKSLDYGGVKMTIYYHNKKEYFHTRVFWIPDGYYSDDQISLCVQSNFYWWGVRHWTTPLYFNNELLETNTKYLFIRGCQQRTDELDDYWSYLYRSCADKGCPKGTGKYPVQGDTVFMSSFVQKCISPGVYGHNKVVMKFISEDQLKFEYGNNESHVLRKGTGDCIPIIIITNAVTAITPTTATTGGTIDYSGTSTITSRGVVWNTSPDPTLRRMMNRTTDGTGTGSFTSTISGLSPSTTYYVNTYAISSNKDTVYGTSKSFTTPSASADTLDYESINGIVTSLEDRNFETESMDNLNIKYKYILYYIQSKDGDDSIAHEFVIGYKDSLGSTPKMLHPLVPQDSTGIVIPWAGINGSNCGIVYAREVGTRNEYYSSSGTVRKVNGYLLVDAVFKEYVYLDRPEVPRPNYTFIRNITYKAKIKFPY